MRTARFNSPRPKDEIVASRAAMHAAVAAANVRMGTGPHFPHLGGITVDLDDRLGEGVRSFLRQIVPDTAFDDPVRILA